MKERKQDGQANNAYDFANKKNISMINTFLFMKNKHKCIKLKLNRPVSAYAKVIIYNVTDLFSCLDLSIKIKSRHFPLPKTVSDAALSAWKPTLRKYSFAPSSTNATIFLLLFCLKAVERKEGVKPCLHSLPLSVCRATGRTRGCRRIFADVTTPQCLSYCSPCSPSCLSTGKEKSGDAYRHTNILVDMTKSKDVPL